MQQMNNILLAPSAKNGASSGKTMSQDTNSEDFSVALASVTSTSTPSTKTRVSQEAPVKSSQSETNVDESDTDDKADINLIFAQIGMANEMKKAAAPGEALPLDADIIATEDAEPASSSILADDQSQTDESLVVGNFSDELARFTESSTANLGNLKLDSNGEQREAGLLTTVSQNAEQVSAQILQPQSSSLNGAEEVVDDALTAALEISFKANSFGEDSSIADDGFVLASLRSDKFIKTSENHILPIEGEPILGSKELGTKEMELSGKVMNMPTPRTDTAMSPVAVDNQASIKASASDVDILQVNAASVSNVKDSNSLGTVSIDPDLATENPSRAEISAGFLLKDAKLAVSLDTPQDSRLTSFNTDESSGVESKPVEFKLVSSLHSLTTQVTNRQDIPQVQLSLRQGVETQNQMQEMIQRFSPVMKQQLVTMVSQGIQQAEIRLDPPELGHMLVKVQVHGDQTQVQFHVTQSQTRDMVEQAIPRLRELLQEQGMQLADSHVSHGDQGQRREGGFGEAGGSGSGNMDDFSAEELDLGLNQATSLNSGIDYYA